MVVLLFCQIGLECKYRVKKYFPKVRLIKILLIQKLYKIIIKITKLNKKRLNRGEIEIILVLFVCFIVSLACFIRSRINKKRGSKNKIDPQISKHKI